MFASCPLRSYSLPFFRSVPVLLMSYQNCFSFPRRAPQECLQYFTGTSGSFQSYNYNSGNGQLLDEQDYTTCFRQEEGENSVYCPPRLKPFLYWCSELQKHQTFIPEVQQPIGSRLSLEIATKAARNSLPFSQIMHTCLKREIAQNPLN